MNGMINTISRLKELTRCCHFDSQDDNEEKTHVTHLLYVFSSGTTWFTMWYHVVYHMVVPDYHMVVSDYHMVYHVVPRKLINPHNGRSYRGEKNNNLQLDIE